MIVKRISSCNVYRIESACGHKVVSYHIVINEYGIEIAVERFCPVAVVVGLLLIYAGDLNIIRLNTCRKRNYLICIAHIYAERFECVL